MTGTKTLFISLSAFARSGKNWRPSWHVTTSNEPSVNGIDRASPSFHSIRPTGEVTGFANTTVRIEIGTVRFQSIDQFVSLYAAGTPLSTHVSHMSEKAYSAMVENVRSGLASYVDDEGLAFPIEANLATATTP